MALPAQQSKIEFREARPGDGAAIAQVFNESVTEGAFTYEERPQTAPLREEWICRLREQGYPALVAEAGGTIVGFAALTPFHPASGYRFTAGAVIYLKGPCRGRGLGTQLARELFDRARQTRFHCVLAGVNASNEVCQNLLRSLGFVEAGRFRQIAFKGGQWHDDICFQLLLKDGAISPGV